MKKGKLNMTRRERLERRAERRREWAKSREAKSNASCKAGDLSEEASGIPLGQPILVGHHSERRHRTAIERAENAMRRAVEHSDMAEKHAQKAAGIESMLENTIFSDDPDAIERLEERIADLDAQRKRNNAINRIIRKNPRNEATPEKLAELKELTGVDYSGVENFTDIAVPGYRNSNLGGRIRSAKQRIASIKRREISYWTKARFDSSCAECKASMTKGDQILYNKAEKRAICESCGKKEVEA